MGLLENYKEQNPEAFREKPQWEPPREYGFFIRMVMKMSGGRIRDVNTASYALAIAAGIILIVSLFLFFGGPSANLRPEEKSFLQQGKSTESYDKKLFGK